MLNASRPDPIEARKSEWARRPLFPSLFGASRSSPSPSFSSGDPILCKGAAGQSPSSGGGLRSHRHGEAGFKRRNERTDAGQENRLLKSCFAQGGPVLRAVDMSTDDSVDWSEPSKGRRSIRLKQEVNFTFLGPASYPER